MNPERPAFRWKLHLGLALLGPLAFLASELAGRHPDLVERVYARGLYPWIARGLSALTAPIPFVVMEVLMGLFVLGILGALVWAGLGLWAWQAGRRSLGGVLLRGGLRLGAALGVMGFLFVGMWALNYRRPPLARTLDWSPGPFAPAEMLSLGQDLRRDLDALAPACATVPPLTLPEALQAAPASWGLLPAHWPVHGCGRARPKALAMPWIQSRLLTTGVFWPMTGEPTVNGTIPAAWMPFVAAHELAHQRGIAREDEANFLGYALCRRHPDPRIRHAATLWAFDEVLGRVSLEEAQGLVRELPAGALADLRAGRAWVRQWQGPVSRGGGKVYGGLLKSQGQADGLRSYGRFLDLILAERRMGAAPR